LPFIVYDINKKSLPEQKLLWLQINLEKLSSLAKKLDASVGPHNLSPDEIDALITEARKNTSQPCFHRPT